MSVSVKNLTKTYGAQNAVDHISFEVKKGEILGFLGPNGAGKTTTMKVLTCFIPKTSGEASVCGFDVDKNPIEVRERIGYLPEHNPLYKSMYVREYLSFTAGLHRIAKPKARVDEMIEVTGLNREAHKQIGALSKGYRQRVGLAQAMIHDPEVLILDEPTSGLDPNQLIEIRGIIRKLGEQKTVIFSSHIMQEVEALCDRVVIINRGQIVADDNIGNLQRNLKAENRVVVAFSPKLDNPSVLKRINGVIDFTVENGEEAPLYHIRSDKSIDIRPALFNLAVEQQKIILELHQEASKIEDVFQSLTSK
jgi:ABC-2 type transport system ATP-binding protein